MTVIIITRCCCAFKSTEPIQKQSSALCFSLWWLSELQCVFCIHKKKPSVWLTLNCLSLLEVPVCLHPTRVTKIARRWERMCKKKHLDVHFLLKLAFLDLRAAKHSHTKSLHVHLEENSVISDSFRHWIVLFFWACKLGVLQLHVIESLLVFVYVWVLFPMIHPFIPFFGELITMSKTAGARRPFTILTQVSS